MNSEEDTGATKVTCLSRDTRVVDMRPSAISLSIMLFLSIHPTSATLVLIHAAWYQSQSYGSTNVSSVSDAANPSTRFKSIWYIRLICDNSKTRIYHVYGICGRKPASYSFDVSAGVQPLLIAQVCLAEVVL